MSLAVTVALWLYGALWIGTAGSPEVVIIIIILSIIYDIL